MNNNYFPQYTTDYISGVMSLRKPQTASLKILEEIVNSAVGCRPRSRLRPDGNHSKENPSRV